MTAAGEYKSVVGLDSLYVSLVTLDDSTGYTAATPEYFAPAAEASAEPITSQDTQYADDGPYDVLTSEGSTTITLTVTAIPLSTLAKYLGKTYDAASGRMFDHGGTPPDATLSFRSLKSNGSYRYFQYLKGKFSVPKDEAVTKGEKAEPKPTQIIYTAMATTYAFDVGSTDEHVKRVVGDSDALNFSGTTWFSQVQTPVITTPDALALSSSVPTDGTASIAIAANQTLTFNNALLDTAVNGVGLFVSATGVVVAGAVSLDTAKKVITNNPNASLALETHYLLTYAVTDIYGQSLAGAVDFTTATA